MVGIITVTPLGVSRCESHAFLQYLHASGCLVMLYMKCEVLYVLSVNASLHTHLQVYILFTVVLAVHGTSQMYSEEVNVAPSPPELEVIAPRQVRGSRR